MTRPQKQEPHWLSQMEQALEMLRRAPVSTWACHFAGALPFTLALIYFLAEMLQSPYARQRLLPLSLLLSMAYLWKQCWQAAFMAGLRDQLAGQISFWSAGRVWHLVTRQAVWQPLAIATIPLSFFALVPFPTVFAFFRQVSLLAGRGESAPFRTVVSASLGDLKTHALALLIFVLAFLGLWLNLFATIIVLPQLGQSIFGVVSDWSKMGQFIVNRVTVSISLALTWMLLDPLIDAFYVQRSFREEARTSGLDLTAALRRLLATAALLALFVPALPASALTAEQVDKAADQVLQREEFAWRAQTGAVDEGPVMSWFRQASRWISEKVDGLFDWVKKLFDRPPDGAEGAEGAAGKLASLRWLLIGLAAMSVALAAVLFYRAWNRSRELRAALPATGKLTKIDLTDESVTADALEESGWLNLADELMAQGDYRLALRALHLAGLRYLGGRGLVTLARWKSGYEYQRELDRRLRAEPRVAQLFGGNLLRFEMVWYGRHQATQEAVAGVRESWKEIRTHAG